MSRINKTFEKLKVNNKKAFISYIMAGDPSNNTSLELLNGFAESGVDIIELGMPFSDPMAEGPTIQKAAKRSVNNNINIDEVLKILKTFRQNNKETPVILMGYYNPILNYGVENFIKASTEAGADGFIIVDLPFEEEKEFLKYNSNLTPLIKLTSPTTDEARARKTLKNAEGFVYHVSVAGVTGQKEAVVTSVEESLKIIKEQTNTPICIGFGIKTKEQAKDFSKLADGIVIGSTFVNMIEKNLDNPNKAVEECLTFAQEVRKAIDS